MPKLVLDEKTGELAEATREDQIVLGLQPLEDELDEEIVYKRVLRSNLVL